MADTYSEFAEWSGHDTPTQAQEVNALAIDLQNISGPIYYVSDYGQPISLVDEGGTSHDYEPVGFTIEAQEVGPTTEQSILIHMDGLNGFLYSILKNMTSADRQKEITITHRSYLDTFKTAPAFDPPPVYTLKEGVGNLGSLKLKAQASTLPNKRAGVVYTPSQFKTLYFT